MRPAVNLECLYSAPTRTERAAMTALALSRRSHCRLMRTLQRGRQQETGGWPRREGGGGTSKRVLQEVLSNTGIGDNRMSRNSITLASFVAYCRERPEQRFWQALRNWGTSSMNSIKIHTVTRQMDTFYWEGRDPEADTGPGMLAGRGYPGHLEATRRRSFESLFSTVAAYNRRVLRDAGKVKE